MLKYFFEVEYLDGSTFLQNKDDVSLTDPLRSAYFDVDQEKIKTFSLKGNGHTYSVDMTDGHFEIDGVPFRFHDEEIKNLRLIFFRRHRHSVNVTSTGSIKEVAHTIVYRIGWQCTINGKNIQRVMEVD